MLNKEIIKELGLLDYSHSLNMNLEHLKNEDFTVLLLVITRWTDVEKRQAFRRMISRTNKNELTFKYKLVFLFNVPLQEYINNDSILTRESVFYKDFLVPNTEDNYKTVALKLLSAFQLIHHNFAAHPLKWIVKLDDDVILNLYNLDHYLSSNNVTQEQIHCKANYGSPMRQFDTKWYISKMEFNEVAYPPFCYGPIYIMTPQTGYLFYELFAETFRELYIWIEDTYITGSYYC